MTIEEKRRVLASKYPHWNIKRFSDKQIAAMYEKYCRKVVPVPVVRQNLSTVYEANGRLIYRFPSGQEVYLN